ncbi:VOC family protein [Microbacterium sp. NPDC055442]
MGAQLRFWHVGLAVASMSRSIAFYCDGLGMQIRRRASLSPAATAVWGTDGGASGDVVFLGLDGGPEILELIEVEGLDRVDASSRPWDIASAHFALETDDLGALFDRMVAAGYSARSSSPVVAASGVLAGGSAVYFVDPDGFHVEVVQRPPGV